MNYSTDRSHLTSEQAVWSVFRSRAVSEFRLLNRHLPHSQRLERREINRLVEDLLHAVRQTPKLRNASMLDKTIWTASAVLVRAVRRRTRTTETTLDVPLRSRKPGEERNVSKGDPGAARLRGGHTRSEIPNRAIADNGDESRGPIGRLRNVRSAAGDGGPGSTARNRDQHRAGMVERIESEPTAQAPEC